MSPGSDWSCHYCQEEGHWKAECPLLRARHGGAKLHGSQVRPTALAAPVRLSAGLTAQTEPLTSTFTCVGDRKVTFDPFISEGWVSLAGNEQRVPVKRLRDTGTSESFILESVLPFSTKSHTGDLLARGIGINTLSVPLHKITLHCDLVMWRLECGQLCRSRASPLSWATTWPADTSGWMSRLLWWLLMHLP